MEPITLGVIALVFGLVCIVGACVHMRTLPEWNKYKSVGVMEYTEDAFGDIEMKLLDSEYKQ